MVNRKCITLHCIAGSRPCDKGEGGGGGMGGAVFQNFFRQIRPQFALKIRGGAGPPGLFPGSATALCNICTNLCPPIIHPRGVKHLQVPRYEKKELISYDQ